METVKLMIELPKEIYATCRNCFPEEADAIESVIANGTIINECNAEECISREYLNHSMIEYGWKHPDSTVTEYVDSLPSVYPKSDKPSGKWIEELKQELLENIPEDTTDRWDTLTSCIAIIDAKMESEDNE